MSLIHFQSGMSPLPLQLGLVRQPPRAKCRRTCCSLVPNQKPQILTLSPPQINSSTRAHTKDARMPSCLPWICPRWALRTGVVCCCLSVLRSSQRQLFWDAKGKTPTSQGFARWCPVIAHPPAMRQSSRPCFTSRMRDRAVEK